MRVQDIDQKDFELVVKRFTSVMFGLTCSPSLLSMTVRHHALKYFDLDENLVVKFLNDLHMDVPLAVLILLKKCIEFCLRMKAILKEGTLTSENGFLIVPKLWKKSIPSRNKSLARKLFTLINFIKFWVFCGTLKLMNCSFDLKNVVSESQISPKHEFLKVLSSVCDPLGVVSPTTD